MVERQKKKDGKTKEEWKEGKNGGQQEDGNKNGITKRMMNRRMMERKEKAKKGWKKDG